MLRLQEGKQKERETRVGESEWKAKLLKDHLSLFNTYRLEGKTYKSHGDLNDPFCFYQSYRRGMAHKYTSFYYFCLSILFSHLTH